MARKPRVDLPGVPQHVVQRGNDRQACFFTADDYASYLAALREAALKYGVRVHAYCLMSNHVHLLMTPDKQGAISATMQSLGRQYVRLINGRHRRTGTLWEGRFRACVVDSGRYLLSCYRYIELNPVRARMVAGPGDYRWSSYRANAEGRADNLVTPHDEYLQLGAGDDYRRRAYQTLFEAQLDPQALAELRAALNQELAFGSEGFKGRIENAAQRLLRPGKPGRPKKAAELHQQILFSDPD